MASPVPIPNSQGLIPGNVLTTIYLAQGTSVVSRITNIKFSPQDLVTAYEIKLYVSYNSGATDRLIYYKSLDGGDSISDDSIYNLTNGMRLKAFVNVNDLISYVISGELITV